MRRRRMSLAPVCRRRLRRVVVLLCGGVGLLSGVAMLALPGPGLLVIIGSLALLATEFLWARRLRDGLGHRISALRQRRRARQRRRVRRPRR